MSGVRDSEKKNPHKYDKKERPTLDSIQPKYKTADLTIDELTELVNAIKTDEYKDDKRVDSKTIKKYLKVIANKSGGLININDFKSDPSNPKSPFCIKPEWHGILLSLMCTQYFEGRSNDRKLSTRSDLNNRLAKYVNLLLDDIDIKKVKEHPSYVNAELEAHYTRQINNYLMVLLQETYHAVPVLRHVYMTEILKELIRLTEWIGKVDAMEMSTRLVYAHELDEMEDALYQKGLFKSETLDELLINLLAMKMNDKPHTWISEDERLTPSGLYLASKMFSVQFEEGSAAQEMIRNMDEAIERDRRYQELEYKAGQILNLDNPDEKLMFDDLMQLVKNRYCTPEVSPEDYNRAVRFTESAIAQNKWDIINIFKNAEKWSIKETEISKIEEIVNGKLQK